MDADTRMLTSALAMLDEPPTNLKEMLTRSVILAARRKQAATSDYAKACHDCALGLLSTAREVKRDGNTREVIRLVNNSRWYWRRFTNEMLERN